MTNASLILTFLLLLLLLFDLLGELLARFFEEGCFSVDDDDDETDEDEFWFWLSSSRTLVVDLRDLFDDCFFELPFRPFFCSSFSASAEYELT